MKISRIFKVSFQDGATHYGRSTGKYVKSIESYIKSNISVGKFHRENPHIHAMAEFEEKLINGEDVSCEIVYEGTNLTECVEYRDTLISNDVNCMNFRKSQKCDGTRTMNQLVETVKKQFSKILTSNGQKIYFISKEYGLKKGWLGVMNCNKVYPLDSSFCEITIPLNRI